MLELETANSKLRTLVWELEALDREEEAMLHRIIDLLARFASDMPFNGEPRSSQSNREEP